MQSLNRIERSLSEARSPRRQARIEEDLYDARDRRARLEAGTKTAAWIVNAVRAHPRKDSKWIAVKYGIPNNVVKRVQEQERHD